MVLLPGLVINTFGHHLLTGEADALLEGEWIESGQSIHPHF